jgi:hypothetical protein
MLIITIAMTKLTVMISAIENQQDNNILELLRLIFLEHFYIIIAIWTASLSPRLGRENEKIYFKKSAGENNE